MAIVQECLFQWSDVEASSEIQRFALILENLPDEALMRHLEADRAGKRNDNPIRAMWNSLIAALVFRHPSIESLRAELGRNGELRQVCGFDPLKKAEEATPSPDAYSRFIKKLTEHEAMVADIFHALVERLRELLPDFGQRLAADGKAIRAARKDDADAAVGHKKIACPDHEDGEISYKWFGYKLHMLADATYELPVAFEITNASEHESPHLMQLMKTIAERHPQIIERAETLAADKGYDDGADKQALYDDYGIAPLIPARDLHKGQYRPLDESAHDTIFVGATGEVCCKIHPFATDDAERFAPMPFCGFEEKRGTLKFRCPAAAYGLTCDNRAACACRPSVKDGQWGRTVRVKIKDQPRLWGPIYEHSYRFKDIYKGRTSVERLFFRVDHLYGFERHHTVGLKRMQLRGTLAMIAMQATAVGWIILGQKERIRSLRLAA